LLLRFIVEGRAKFHLEIVENKVVIFFPSKCMDLPKSVQPQVRNNLCKQCVEVFYKLKQLTLEILHVDRSLKCGFCEVVVV
jgi:hypothetical protein